MGKPSKLSRKQFIVLVVLVIILTSIATVGIVIYANMGASPIQIAIVSLAALIGIILIINWLIK